MKNRQLVFLVCAYYLPVTFCLGQVQFADHTIVESVENSADGANSVYAVDMDSDGDMDVLSDSYYKITWYENEGNENFTAHVLLPKLTPCV